MNLSSKNNSCLRNIFPGGIAYSEDVNLDGIDEILTTLIGEIKD
jgi:hypothetical protein